MTTFKKYRKRSKIDELPEEIKNELDELLLDTRVTYTDISGWLKEQGYDISKSTVGKYALETKKLASRLLETQARVQELVKVARQNQDDEYLTEGALQIAVNKLSESIALIEEELEELPPDKAIELMIKLSRAKAYKDKVYAALRGEYETAYKKFKQMVYAELESDYPEIAEKLMAIANQTLGEVYQK